MAVKTIQRKSENTRRLAANLELLDKWQTKVKSEDLAPYYSIRLNSSMSAP